MLDLLGKDKIDRTMEEPDTFNLQKIKNNFTGKLAEPYRGPWEISEIREIKEKILVYS